MLYHPDLTEIRPIMAKAIRAWPQLESRIEKAEQILLNFDLRYRGKPENAWQVASQVKDDGTAKWYDVDDQTCSCADFMHGRGRAGGRIYCKHLIAFGVYREILTLAMINLIDESVLFNHDGLRRIDQFKEPILLSVDNLIQGANYSGRRLDIHFAHDAARNRRKFATAFDMSEFAYWYDSAQPAIRAAAEEQFVIDNEPATIDAAIMPFEMWRELYPGGVQPKADRWIHG